MTLSEEYVRIGDRSIRFIRQGSGPTLLLVHGIGASADWWLPNFPFLASRYSVIAVDLPGSGLSDSMTQEDFSEPENFISAFIDHLSIDSFAMIGHSMGGYVATRFALKHSDRVTHLVLVDSAGFSRVLHPTLRAATIPLIGEVTSFTNSLFYDKTKVPAEIADKTQQYAKRRGYFREFLRMLRSGVGTNGSWKRDCLLDSIQRYMSPLLVIWGENDPVFSADTARLIGEISTRAEVHVFAHCGHVPQTEFPERFSDLVSAFVTY